MAQKKQGFVFGALILMLSNIIVKVVNALFKIPLANIIGDTAMGYFSSAYSIYSMCFLISTAGLPVAISHMIAAAKAKENHREVSLVYRISLIIFIIIGLLGTALMFFAADLIAEWSKEPELGICIQTISPIMLFICLVSCIRGYFQGHQNMIPTAVSQVIEVLGNLLLGLTAGVFAKRQGFSNPEIAAFVLGGVVLGIVASAVYMAFAKWLADRDNATNPDPSLPARSPKALAKELVFIAIPITVSSSILSLNSVIDSLLAVGTFNEVCAEITYFSLDAAAPVGMTLYGAYMAKAVTLFNLPPTIVYPFAISIIPAISSAEAKKDDLELKKTMDFTFRIVSVICLPCAFGLSVLAKPIIDLLFSNNEAIYQNAAGTEFFSNSVVAPMLSVLACAILFSGLISVSGAMLQAAGRAKVSILSTCCGVATKALLVLTLIRIPAVGHYGIPLSTLGCFVVMFLFNMVFLAKYLKYRMSFRQILLKPLFSAALCGAVALGGYFCLKNVLSPSLATVGSIALAALTYVVALFKTRGFGEEDVLQLPKGEWILKILKKVHLLTK